MKKTIILLLSLCLVGCSQTPPKEETPKLSIASLFNQTGMNDNWQRNDVFGVFSEFQVISENKMSQIDVVYNQKDKGFEFSITEEESLQQLSDYFLKASQESVIKFASEYESVDNQNAFVFKVSFVDQDPVYFKGSEGYFCVTNSECIQYSYDHVLPKLRTYEKDSKEVLPVNLDEANTMQINWTSRIVEPEVKHEPSNELVIHWGFDELDSRNRALQMALYIKEDMNSLNEITKWDSIIGGLAIHALKDNKAYEQNSVGDFVGPYQDVLPFDLAIDDAFQGRVFALSYQSVIDMGKELFGSDFEMKEVGTDLVNIAAYSVKHVPEYKCFVVYSNYESETSDVLGEIIGVEENSEQVKMRMLLFSKGMNYETGEEYYVNSNGDVFTTYIGNEKQFDEVQITLNKNEEVYQVSAFNLINDIKQELIENEEGQESSDVEETN